MINLCPISVLYYIIFHSISVVVVFDTRTDYNVMVACWLVYIWVHYHSFVVQAPHSCVLSLAEKNITIVECVAVMLADVLTLPLDVLPVAKQITTLLTRSMSWFM